MKRLLEWLAGEPEDILIYGVSACSAMWLMQPRTAPQIVGVLLGISLAWFPQRAAMAFFRKIFFH